MTIGFNDEDALPLFGLKIASGRRGYAIDARDWQPMKIGGQTLPGYFWIPVADDENGAWRLIHAISFLCLILNYSHARFAEELE